MIDSALKREAFRKLPEEMRDWYVSDDLRAVIKKDCRAKLSGSFILLNKKIGLRGPES